MSGVDRAKELGLVFRAFDLDGSGFIEPEELLVLGKRRRELGQKQGYWTAQMNSKLVHAMDRNHDGKVEEREFVEHFVEALGQIKTEWLSCVRC